LALLLYITLEIHELFLLMSLNEKSVPRNSRTTY
jgi:hypothetical protein